MFKFYFQTAVAYVIAQLLGAYMGYGLLRFITPMKMFAGNNGFCVTLPSDDISIGQAFMVEFVITAVLIFVCCGVWDPRNGKLHDSVPLRFGLAVTCLALSGVRIYYLISFNKILMEFNH